MGTPGMAYIRIDGQTKIIRSRYDGHVNSFGHGVARCISEMPMPAFEAAARAYHYAEEGETSDALPPSIALAAYAEACGSRLGPDMMNACMGIASHQPDFGVPYIGLGPVLMARAGEDESDMGYDYAYLVDFASSSMGLVHNLDEDNPDKSELLWRIPFASLQAIDSESALGMALSEISEIDHDYEAPNFKKIQSQVDRILAKAATASPAKIEPFGQDEDAMAAKIMAIPDAPEQSAADLARGDSNSGTNFTFSHPVHAMLADAILALAAEKDPAILSFCLSSRFGQSEDGRGGGQLRFEGCADNALDERASALFESFREALGAIGQPTSSFAGAGMGGFFSAEEPEEPAGPSSLAERYMPLDELREVLADQGPEAIAQRIDFFDAFLALNLARADWLPLSKESLARDDLPQMHALNFAGFALGTCDRELLAAVAQSPAAKTILRAPSEMTQTMGSMAARSIQAMSALNPKAALQFAQDLKAGPFAELIRRASPAELLWIDKPASCIQSRRGALLDYLGGTTTTRPRFRGY